MRVDEVTRLARLTEDLGYDDLWIPDQSFHHDPFLLLGECARVTSSIRLGVAVTNPVSRHPVQLARAAATLGEISGGRFVLGLGAGNRTRVLPALGLPTDHASRRISEAIEMCRRLLAGEEVAVAGGSVSPAGVRLESGPAGPVPIFVGSRGPAVLRVAGAQADGVFVEAMFTPEGIDYAVGAVEAGAREAGRAPEDVEVVAWQAVRLSTTLAAADERRYRRWAALLMRSTRPDVLERIGIPRSTIHAARDAFDASGEDAASSVVPDEVVRRLVLSGDPDEVATQIAVMAPRIDSVAIIGFGNTDVVHDTIRRFAEDVMARSDRRGRS
jgi:5,10-methylenetetrahydromethanopterin reductase